MDRFFIKEMIATFMLQDHDISLSNVDYAINEFGECIWEAEGYNFKNDKTERYTGRMHYNGHMSYTTI